MNSNKQMSLSMVLCWSITACLALGDQGPQLNLAAPKFIPLEIGEESLSFAVKDESTTTELEKVSFWGSTAISGVCREDNDSVTAIHLAYTQKIKIVQQEYKSQRYPNKEFCLVEKTNIDGTMTDGLLVPAKLVVCGIDKHSKDEEAWFLGKIDQLVRLDKNDGQHHDVAVAKHIEHLTEPSDIQSVPHHHKAHKMHKHHKPHDPAATKILEKPVEQNVDKKIVLLEKQTGAMEQKSIVQAFTDLLVAMIGVLKAVFETVRGLFL